MENLYQPQEFSYLYKTDKNPKQALEDVVNLKTTKGHIFRDAQTKKFLYFDNHMTATTWFYEQEKPYIHSVINKYKPVRFNLELDMDIQKLDNIKLSDNIVKKIKNSDENINHIKSILCFSHIKNKIYDILETSYAVEPSDYMFLEASDNRPTKYSYRIYMKLAFSNIAEYKHFITLLKQEVRPDVVSMIDPTSLMLRTPESFKDEHRAKWITPDASFEDSILSYTENCDVLNKIAPEEEVILNNDITGEEQKQAVARLSSHEYIMGNFCFTKSTGNLLSFARHQPSHCSICNRTHDKSDCYGYIVRGNVYIGCFRDDTKTSIYAGYIGDEIEPFIFKWFEIKNLMKAIESKSKIGLSNKEKIEISNEQTRLFASAKKEANINAEEFLKLGTNEFGFVFDNFTQIHNKTFPNNEAIIEYLKQAVFKILQGGDSFYITKSTWKKTKHFTELKQSVFKGDDAISYSIINPDFNTAEPVGQKNTMLINRDLGKVITDYLKTHFYKAVDFVPYLIENETQKTSNEIFNLFEGFRFNYEPQEYKESIVDEVNIPAPTAKVQPWINHIINSVCAGNRKLARTLIQWMAHIVQKPTEKSFAVILYGKQGTGKSILYEFFKNAIGSDLGLQVSKLEDLTQTHNKIVRGRLIVNCNEATNYPSIRDTNILKGFITETDLLINPKNCPLYYISNYSRLMTTTNCKFSARLDSDDRRWACFEVSEQYRNNDEYFKPLVDTMKDENTLHEFFLYLANFDISDFKCQRPPMTKLKQSMIKDQLPDIIQFMRAVCENDTESEYTKDTVELIERGSDLYIHYKRWFDDNVGGRILGKQKFNTELRDRFGLMLKLHRVKGETKRVYGFKINRDRLLTALRESFGDKFEYHIQEDEE